VARVIILLVALATCLMRALMSRGPCEELPSASKEMAFGVVAAPQES
jgi:hypothetical protein